MAYDQAIYAGTPLEHALVWHVHQAPPVPDLLDLPPVEECA
jgi:hypothetical protein